MFPDESNIDMEFSVHIIVHVWVELLWILYMKKTSGKWGSDCIYLLILTPSLHKAA